MYYHRWGKPSAPRTTGGYYVPAQECELCGTARNPLNHQITHRARGASRTCWSRSVPPEGLPSQEDLLRWNRELTEELRFLESAGEDVDWSYGDPNPDREPEPTLEV